jgi:N-acetylneuraminate synthase
MSQLAIEAKRVWQALGKVHYGLTEAEKASVGYRRSLYITKDLKSGDVLTADNLRSVRPGLGLPPKYYDVLLGQAVNRDLQKGTPVTWDYLKHSKS